MITHDFPPVFDEKSRVLILGSFPSVKSRKVSFYYGNRQNRFWGMLYGYFNLSPDESTEEKIAFLLRHNVALWDMVEACEIDGSSDATIRSYRISDLNRILSVAPIERILLNGTTAYQIFLEGYADLKIPFVKLPSTSPANPRYSPTEWRRELDVVFRAD